MINHVINHVIHVRYVMNHVMNHVIHVKYVIHAMNHVNDVKYVMNHVMNHVIHGTTGTVRRHACVLESVSHQQNDEAVSNCSDRERRDRSCSCKVSQGSWQHARKTVLAILSQKYSMCSDVEHDAGTRNGLAGLWLCTDASEPQYS